MKSNTNHKTPSGSGARQRLGLCIGWILRKECQFLMRKGLSVSFAKKIVVVINLFILISLLFIVFPMWMGLVTLIVGALLLAGVDIDISPSPQEEWRMGPSGWGLYKGEDCIIWKDDPDDLND